jgi:hypothetical protein
LASQTDRTALEKFYKDAESQLGYLHMITPRVVRSTDAGVRTYVRSKYVQLASLCSCVYCVCVCMVTCVSCVCVCVESESEQVNE